MLAGHFKTAVANLRASRWRSGMTILGIVIGVSSVITIVSLGQGLKQQVVGQINHLGSDVITIRPGKLTSGDNQAKLNPLALLSASTLTDKDVTALSKSNSLESVVPINFVTSDAASNESEVTNASVIGTEPDLTQMLSINTNFGISLTEPGSEDKIAIVGQDVAAKLYGELNPVGHVIKIGGQDFVVRGVLAPSSTGLLVGAATDFNSVVLIPYSPSKGIANGNTNLMQILVRPKSGVSTNQAIADSRKILLANHDNFEDFTILKQHQLLNLLGGVVNTATSFITAIAAIALLVGGIGIMDIMLASVSERTREIGIRKAVGATNRQILMQFFSEGLVLSLAGGVLGVLFALAINFILRLYTNLHPLMNVAIMLLAVGVAVAVGVTFSIAPAIKASRKDPIVALRG